MSGCLPPCSATVAFCSALSLLTYWMSMWMFGCAASNRVTMSWIDRYSCDWSTGGGDGFARYEADRPGTERDQLGDAEDHLRRRGVLQGLAADLAPDPKRLRIGDLFGGDEPRPHRQEPVDRLAEQPL